MLLEFSQLENNVRGKLKDDYMYLVTVQRDWFDYLATGVTLLFSGVAVIIAVSTAKRQNKIALFDKRFAVISALMQIVEFSRSTVKFNSDATTANFWNGIINLKLWVVEKERFGVALPELAIKDDVNVGSFRCGQGNVDYDVQVLNAKLLDDLLQLKKAELLLSKKTALLVNELRRAYKIYVVALFDAYSSMYDKDFEAKQNDFLKAVDRIAQDRKANKEFKNYLRN